MADQKNDCEMNGGDEDFTQDVETNEQMNGNSDNQDESQNGNHENSNAGGRDDDRFLFDKILN
uniref:Uncharacterized protein n=1 Tax=Megaselia scalaris TaxID=36166 RepID=T1GUR2_MEGSC